MSGRQSTLGDDEREADTGLSRDDGEGLSENETCMGFNRFDVSSLLQKSVRRGDREKAIWSAFELSRSGYGWNFWERAEIMLVEDLRLTPNESHLVNAIRDLSEMADEWGRGSRKGVAAAMRAASLLAEAESSRELFFMQDYWNDELDDIDELTQADWSAFPIKQDLTEVERQVLDQHTGEGSKKGRGHRHFMTVASRTSETSKLDEIYKKRMMEEEDIDYTDEEIDNAVSEVKDDPWREKTE